MTNESFDREGASLPPAPEKREDFKAWSAWADKCRRKGRWPERGSPAAWRAVLAHWADKTLDPEELSAVSFHFLERAHEAPPYVMKAADLLLVDSMEQGVTSPDVLFLASAFAWPLRDLVPARSAHAWQYLVHAPWQTDASTLVTLCREVEKRNSQDPGRRLIDLASMRLEADQRGSGRELLEAIALIRTDRKRIEEITSVDVYRKITTPDDAVALLARIYAGDEDATQPYAFAIVKHAAEKPSRDLDLIHVRDNRVWERPFAALYEWGKGRSAKEIESEIGRLKPTQPHCARQLAETILVRQYDEPMYGIPPSSRASAALRKFSEAKDDQILKDHSSRAAAEHLALLCLDTRYSTEEARQFVSRVSQITQFTGVGARLHEVKDELQEFVNSTDPYQLIRREADEIDNAGSRFNDSEKKVGERVNEWFRTRYGANRTTLDRVITGVTATIADVATVFSELVPGLEQASQAAFRVMISSGSPLAGNLQGLQREGCEIRDASGVCEKLLARADELAAREQLAATLFAGTIALLPPGLGLMASAADLGATLLASYRGVAQVGALFGIDVTTDLGFQFVAESFALGCSSDDQEGIAAYLSRGKKQVLRSFTLGGTAYGGMATVGYLWTAQAAGRKLSEKAIGKLARLCGIGLSRGSLAKVIPIGGAVIAATSTYAFIESILSAAIHLAARESLLRRLES